MVDRFTLFVIEHDLVSLSRYCEHDDRYEMRFEQKDGKVVEFVSTRASVASIYGEESKDDSVSHFEEMGMKWYVQTKFKK